MALLVVRSPEERRESVPKGPYVAIDRQALVSKLTEHLFHERRRRTVVVQHVVERTRAVFIERGSIVGTFPTCKPSLRNMCHIGERFGWKQSQPPRACRVSDPRPPAIRFSLVAPCPRTAARLSASAPIAPRLNHPPEAHPPCPVPERYARIRQCSQACCSKRHSQARSNPRRCLRLPLAVAPRESPRRRPRRP